MEVYCPMVTNGYEYVYPVAFKDFYKLNFDNEPLEKDWETIKVTFGPGLSGSTALRSDFPWLSGLGLVLRSNTATLLRSLIEPHAELLRLEGVDHSELFALNVRRVDGLDYERSDVRRDPGGFISVYNRLSFREDVLRGIDIFRLPDRGSRTFVSGKFVSAVSRNNLVGLDFNRVWPWRKTSDSRRQ